MGYLGNKPADSYLTLEKQTFTTSATDTYTLDRAVSSVNDIELFLNNVRQEPTEAYTISGTTLTLASAITASDSMYCIYQGRAVGTQSPAVGSVTNDMLAGSIATSKLADGSTFATTNGITEADQWVLTTNTQINGIADLTTNLARETDDSFTQIGTGMTQSSGVFTFPSTGFWYISALGALLCNNGASSYVTVRIQSTTDNSTYTTRANAYASASGSNYYTTSFNEYMFNVTDVSTHKIKFNYEIGVSSRLEAGGTKFTFIRLGDAQ